MKPFDRITVCLSLTESDTGLIQYAAMLARSGIGVHFEFVHVAEGNEPDKNSGVPAELARTMESRTGQPFASLTRVVARTHHVLSGSRIDQLLAFLVRQPSDLVLVGHRQSGAMHRSTAVRLAMICPTSVWMIPDGADARIQSVLAPIDFSSHSADSLCIATSIAQSTQSGQCVALHVYFDTSTIRYADRAAVERTRVQSAFEQFVAPLELHGVIVSPRFEEESNVSNAILRVAVEQGSDLIVMSTRGRSLAASVLLGSETWRILTESKIPVLAVKHRGAFLSLFQVLTDQETWSTPTAKAN